MQPIHESIAAPCHIYRFTVTRTRYPHNTWHPNTELNTYHTPSVEGGVGVGGVIAKFAVAARLPPLHNADPDEHDRLCIAWYAGMGEARVREPWATLWDG